MKLYRLFLKDKFIFTLIIINAFTIFVEGYNHLQKDLMVWIERIDIIITCLFIIELVVKSRFYGFKRYLRSNWNKLDFVLILLSLPSLYLYIFHKEYEDISFLLVLRVTRVFKFFRFLKFIPGIDQLLHGIQRALKDSILVILGFFVFNFIIAIISSHFYKNIVPEYFGDPIRSIYSIFKIFTVEGWYEIPDKIAAKTSLATAFFSKVYFITVLLTGGIFGLSLVNSIFVDAMVSDNNDELNHKIDDLNNKVDKLMAQIQQMNAIKNINKQGGDEA